MAEAQAGLAAVIAHQKMPKALLQASLRPILVNLAYYNKLKLPLLQGLARLLMLLANWFNVTLGAIKYYQYRLKVCAAGCQRSCFVMRQQTALSWEICG